MTSLVRWAPFSDLDIMERRMRRMLEDFGVAGGRLPTSDVLETEAELIVKQRYAFSEQEVKQYVPEDAVRPGMFRLVETLYGLQIERAEAPVWHEDAHFYVRERMDKQFERVFVLPPEVDMNKAAATLKEGVLEVRVPKIERVSPRKVEIAA